jgi:tRNA(fMet)-specific endonuclease VapC
LIPVAGKVLLDTSLIVDALAGSIAAWRMIKGAEDVLVPVITVGELPYGAERSDQPETEIARVEAFIARRTVLHCKTETARWYAQIRNHLRAKGRPIPDNDIWIAALARQHRLILVTRDAHFGEVDALPVLSW